MQRDSVDRLIRAQVDLGFRVLGALARSGDGNAVVAPPALGSLLAVLHAGAAGESRDELARALGVDDARSGDPLPPWAEALRSVGAPGDPERVALEESMIARTPRIVPAGTPELFIGASLWVDAPRTVDPDARARLREALEATVETVELGTPEGRARIDAWIRKWTLDTLEGLPYPFPERLDALALGSLFFQAGWKTPFPEEATTPDTFTLPDGSPVELPFLDRSGTWSYRPGPAAEVVRLPYVGDRYALYAVLPDDDRTVGEVLRKLDAEVWSRWTDEAEARDGRVRLPRIRIRANADLGDPLRDAGLDVALDPVRGRFPGFLSDHDALGVTRIRHDALLEVDEEGTRAVGVASGMMEAVLGEPDEPFEFVADRPFLVLLADDDSGAVLLAAVVRNPAPEGYGEERGR